MLFCLQWIAIQGFSQKEGDKSKDESEKSVDEKNQRFRRKH